MPCPVCEREKYCLVSDDGNFVICTKVSSKKKYEAYSGWLHKLSDANFKKPKKVIKSKDYSRNINHIQSVYQNLDKDFLTRFANKLNVAPIVLYHLGVGYDKKSQFYFPMFNADFKMIGLKIRAFNGKRWCVPGSRLGVYIPDDFNSSEEVYICEGESDTAAMLNLGYNAIGKASATSCRNILKELLNCCPIITIVSDYDNHGLGYKESCKLAKLFDSHVNIVLNRNYKDIRAWIDSGTFSHPKLIALKKRYMVSS